MPFCPESNKLPKAPHADAQSASGITRYRSNRLFMSWLAPAPACGSVAVAE